MSQNYNILNNLWKEIIKLNKDNFPDNELMPIFGNGKINKPKFMFIFINPTIRNTSSNKLWNGPRFPFIGTKQIWRIFYKSGLFSDELIKKIEKNSDWSLELAKEVLDFLKNNSFYFTNIVKWTGYDSKLPDSKKIKLFLPILENEIGIIRPKFIVTFGLIPFEKLTKQKINLNNYYIKVMKNKELEFYEIVINSKRYKVIPCYFPTGRGNPKKAIDILKLLSIL